MVFKNIFEGAFKPAAVTGGAVGSLFMSMKKGVSRGIFSNEAGLGTGSIAHACADTRKPVKQGMFGIFEVFTDTIVICTLTALVILCSQVPVGYGQAAGAADLVQPGIYRISFSQQNKSPLEHPGDEFFHGTLFGSTWI